MISEAVSKPKKKSTKTKTRRRKRQTFSWKRALGITKLKRMFTKETGIPLTKAGWERKIGHFIIDLLFGKKKDKKEANNETDD